MIDCNIAVNYFTEKARMVKLTNTGVCAIGCANCPLSEKNNGTGRLCVDYELHYPERAILIVQRWSDAHPPKTYLTQFLDNYPNAELDDCVPTRICPHELGLNDIETCEPGTYHCIECWNQPLPDKERDID